MERILTSGKVAKMLQMAPRTVTKYCDKGWLKSYRLPGSAHRRILHSDLVAFAEKHNIPLKETIDVG